MKLLLHAHTTYSEDGHLQPYQLAALAKGRGFDAVLVTDHFEHLDREQFARLVQECHAEMTCLLVPGYERDWGGYHICAFGVSTWFAGADLMEWANQVRGAGGIVCSAHPTRYHHEIPAEVLDACDAVEIWNSKRPYDGIIGPHPKAYALLGDRRFALVGQDLHKTRDLTGVGLELGDVRTGPEIMAALRAGQYKIIPGLTAFDREPGPALGLGLTTVHWVRPRVWAIPVSGYKVYRSLRKRIMRPALARS